MEQPYLQSSCSQYPRPFILGKVRRRYAHFIWLLFTRNTRSCCRFVSIGHLLVPINSIRSTSIYTVFADMQVLTRLFSRSFAVLQLVCKKVIAIVLDQGRPPTKNTQFDRTEKKHTNAPSLNLTLRTARLINKELNFYFFVTHPGPDS